MNKEKLEKMAAHVRIGGKGTPRRKRMTKHRHRTQASREEKLQNTLKTLSMQPVSNTEVNIIKEDGTVIHFKNPKAQGSLYAKAFAFSGQCEHKNVLDMMPNILDDLGPEGLNQFNFPPESLIVQRAEEVPPKKTNRRKKKAKKD